MIRKMLITALVLMLFPLAVFSEGQAEEGSSSSAIEFWAYKPENEEAGLLAAIKEYEKMSGAKVNVTFIPKDDYNTKLNAAIAGGLAPDIGYLDQPLVPRFATDGVLTNLEEFANGDNGIDRDKYYQGALATNVVGGDLYGLPLNQTCVALYYNKDLMPEAPETWDEWIKMAKDVYVEDQIAAFETPNGDGWGAWLFPAFVASAGGSMVSEDESQVTIGEKPAIDALNLWLTLSEYSDPSVKDSANAFNQGKIATKISGPWELWGLDNNFPELNYGVALIPRKADGGIHASNIGGENMVVFQNSKNPEAAWGLIKFLTYSAENALLMARTSGNFPGLLEAGEDPSFQSNPSMKVFMEQMKTAQPRPRIASWLKINDEVIAKALAQALLGVDTAEGALTLAEEKANMILARER